MPDLRSRRFALGLAAAALFPATFAGYPAGALAQERQPRAALAEIESAVDSGQSRPAREALERWFEENGSPGPSELARARFLRARLAAGAEEARLAYLELAVDGHPEYAPRARLKLAQLQLARDDPAGARRELERLRAEFEGHRLVADAWLWEGRIRRISGEDESACEAFGRAARSAAAVDRPEVRRLAEDALAGCEDGDRLSATPAADGESPEAGRGGNFSVQIGAFGRADPAELLRDLAGEAGFDARVAGPGEDGLFRVKVGRFATEDEARRTADRLQGEGLKTLIVSAGAGGGP